jgi:hypothetical protein
MPDNLQMQSDQLNEYTAAMAKAQLAFDAVSKDSEGQVGQRRYSYPSLASVISATRKGLCDNGLVIDGVVWDGWLVVTVMHISGQFKRSALQLPDPADEWQGFGSAETYARRYLYLAMLSLAGEDDDGVAAQKRAPAKIDPMQPLWDALDTLGIGPGASTQTWCEKVLGRAIPSVSALSKADYDTLLAAAKYLKPKDTATASKPTGLATREQCEALNAALDVLKYGFPGPEPTDPKKLSEAKKLAKLGWANGMLKRSTPISSFAAMTNEEAVRMIAAAQAGEVPEVDPMPDWMGQKPEAKK